MKDEELLEAFEKVERFIDYRYRKSHGNLFLLLGIYFFILLIFSGYGSELSTFFDVPVYVFSVGLIILFIFLYFFFVGSGFHIAHKTGLQKLEEEAKTSFKKSERISYLSVFIILAFIFAFVFYVSSFIDIPYHALLLAGMAAANAAIFLSVKKIYGTPHYHEELLWLGAVFLGAAFISLLLPSHITLFFAAFVFLGSYGAVSLHIYADAEKMLEESVTKEFGSLFSSKSKLSHPVRLGIMILLKRKNRMIFSEIQRVLKLTSGNLNSHLNHLERDGYVSVRKGLISKGPRTIVEITSQGEGELKTYLSRLKVGLLYEEP
jgi:DNA-binding MarR family transcriptional regulator